MSNRCGPPGYGCEHEAHPGTDCKAVDAVTGEKCACPVIVSVFAEAGVPRREPPLAPWSKLLDDVLSGKYDRSEDVVRRIVEMSGTNSRTSDADAPKPAKSTPEERLSRIAQAHSKDVTSGGMTSGLCVECYQNYPCPTYVWATDNQRSADSTWDPIDDEPESEL